MKRMDVSHLPQGFFSRHLNYVYNYVITFQTGLIVFLVDSKKWKSSTVSAESRPEMVAPDLALWGRPGHPVPFLVSCA